MSTPVPADPTTNTAPAPPAPAGAGVRTACLVIIAACVAGTALAALKPILTPLFIALFLFFLTQPVDRLLSRWQGSRWVAYALFLGVVLVGLSLFGVVLSANVAEFEDKLPQYQERAETAIDTLARYTGYADEQGKLDRSKYTLRDLLHLPAGDAMHSVFGTAVEFVEVGLMVVFYLIFLFLEAQKLPARIRKRMAPATAAHYERVGQGILANVRQYLACKTSISLGLGASTGLLCYLFGVDFWLLWGVLMFLANYVTYVGSMAALVPPVLLALVQFEGPARGVALGVVLVVNRTVWIDYAEIRFLGKYLNISPLLLLLSIAFFGFIWGVVGMVLAVPLVTTARIVLEYFEGTRDYAVLISEE